MIHGIFWLKSVVFYTRLWNTSANLTFKLQVKKHLLHEKDT